MSTNDTEAVGEIEPLAPSDAAAGFALSTEAGWNQTIADWSCMLRLGQGFGVRTTTGRLIATSLSLPYPPGFGWVSMVLVNQPYRRRGLATMLLRSAVDHLRARRLVAMLDATPAGRAVYAGLGFSDIEPIDRWRGMGTGSSPPPPETADLPTMTRLDTIAFGGDRHELLRDIAQRPDSRILVRPDGFALVRAGRTATHIGPVIADTTRVSLELVHHGLAHTAGPVILDVPERCTALGSALSAAGFTIERRLTRMSTDASKSFGNPAFVAATAGPELG